ncbi:hypothetical protein PROVRUST_07542 [Providencia rustigianii DSM 4541]|uniref:Uncharacterized protein n=1 Tax=Providencia rustigianii DSM 4541 TaxID=500637 RepID=D1P5N4_9GAMM|nr:hypothetical protein PROVRUST_07542 [Providencia rustigianii DSM 4541]
MLLSITLKGQSGNWLTFIFHRYMKAYFLSLNIITLDIIIY